MKSPPGKTQTYVFYNEAFGTLEPDREVSAFSREEALERALFELGYSLQQLSNQEQGGRR